MRNTPPRQTNTIGTQPQKGSNGDECRNRRDEYLISSILTLALVPLLAMFVLQLRSSNGMRDMMRDLSTEVSDLQSQITLLEEEAAYMEWLVDKQELEGQSDLLTEDALTVSLEQKLADELILRSKAHAIDKFGPGPHYVEIELNFPSDQIFSSTVDRFVIEMAPMDLMPYTVPFFLEQVSRNLYDGCSFMTVSENLILGGLKPYSANKDEPVWEKFFEAGLARYSISEYSPDYPHEEYTLGFAGRADGEFFYISTEDNTHMHGPDKQKEMGYTADPCFGKVVEGFEAVDRLNSMETVGDAPFGTMVESVGIRKARILYTEKSECNC